MKKAIFVLSALTLTLGLGAQEISFEWNDLERGAQYAQFQGEAFGSSQCISVFRYPTKKLATDVVNDSGLLESRQPGGPTAVDPERPSTTTSGFGERYDAMAAINGSYFNMKTLYPTTYVRDEGELEGRTTAIETFRVDGALCVRKKKLDVVPSDTTSYESNFKKYRDVLASGPVLIIDGKVRMDWPDDGFYYNRHPRTAMGTGGGYTYLIVIDGRFRGKAEGMTIPEVAEVCRQLGCTDAINFDGGGSSALWIKSLGVISHPCDNRKWDNAGERVVPNAVIVR